MYRHHGSLFLFLNDALPTCTVLITFNIKLSQKLRSCRYSFSFTVSLKVEASVLTVCQVAELLLSFCKRFSTLFPSAKVVIH